MSSAKEVYDHMGNYFSTVSGMCKYWGISPDLYIKRLSRGWSQKDALTKARRNRQPVIKQITDENGNVFSSISEMQKFHQSYKNKRLYKESKAKWLPELSYDC